jgi:hypothetical protein
VHLLSRIFVWALLSIVPLTGLKMICVEAPSIATTAEIYDAASDECGEMCPRKPVHKRPEPTCVVVAGGCSIELLGVVAVLPSGPPASFVRQTASLILAPPPAHNAPTLSQPSPPPKS